MPNLTLDKITLTHFRNYEKETISFCKGLNCLTGKNGMGKTNLLDAIYYLSMTKSKANSLDKYTMQHGADFIRLEGHFTRTNQQEKIVAKVIPRKSKTIERNNKPYLRLSEHIGLLPVVIIMPDDTAMIQEGSEERRRFLDHTLCQLDAQYLSQLMNYNHLLKQRNALLKQSEQNVNTALLSVYDEQMAAPAQTIFETRKIFMERFLPLFKKYYQNISKSSEEVHIQYQSQLHQKTYLELTKENLKKDNYLQRSHSGIHKDDLIFSMNEQKMKRFASQGQLKSYILSLGLAKYELLKNHQNIQPILLLDDIFDKLDEERVAQLLELLSQDTFGQIFLTDTHEDRIKNTGKHFTREIAIYTVHHAKVTQIII